MVAILKSSFSWLNMDFKIIRISLNIPEYQSLYEFITN